MACYDVVSMQDGVAPRAKMNQQRARRFSAAREERLKREKEEELRREFESQGMRVPPPKKKAWDSNVITPGTPFMAKLSKCLHHFIKNAIEF